MMDAFALDLTLRLAREWATANDPAFGRYFDLSPVDRLWIVNATDADLAEVSAIPTSILFVNVGELSDSYTENFRTPSPSVAAISQILGAVADDLKTRGRVARINWGINSEEKADWLTKSNMRDRMMLADQGRVTFSARAPFSKIQVGIPDSHVRIANVMRILSGGRRSE
ncbi:hypothetical protein [Pseudomonas sp. LS-2]|uniref:hypothetical protein n=1 Tax=Pseudomonas sp. LS-2 TaxID=2315859 RepID=UPI000E753C7D|nr:hypothetical protein [Pseudomonas sp. LS-2]RJX72672.1 hypothetical protein D3M70_31225 [Pseudomonas sp. LS-2]